jgi:hypothetical protein
VHAFIAPPLAATVRSTTAASVMPLPAAAVLLGHRDPDPAALGHDR